MAHDVFVSHSSKDKATADAVCAAIESRGVRCWIAPRDVTPGMPYGEAIIDGSRGARVMVLVFSAHANTSEHIQKEVERAVSNGLAIIPFRIENVFPEKSLDFFIGSVHWLDAMTPPLERHLTQLAETVSKLLDRDGRRAAPSGVFQRVDPPVAAAPSQRKPPSRFIWLGAGAAVVAIVLYVWLGRADPIVGEWTWTGGAPVAIRSNHTFGTGQLEGTWRSVPGKRRSYQLTWPPPTDQITLSVDGRSLAGMNQFGIPVGGTRASGGSSLAGEWRWSLGVPVTIRPDGSAQAGTFLARWEPVNPAARTFRITWPPGVDEVVLSADGNRIQGGNQYGFKVDAPRR